jgi:hypothetical protein
VAPAKRGATKTAVARVHDCRGPPRTGWSGHAPVVPGSNAYADFMGEGSAASVTTTIAC